MRYTKFKFTNFKGIRDLELDLTGDVTTLIGLNESGKTTILEAIFCFSYGAEKLDMINSGMESLRDPEQWIPIALRANFNDTITICATVALDDADQLAFKQHMKSKFDLAVSALPTELEISEHYRFEDSRYVKAKGPSKIWSLNLRGTKDRQRTPRSFEATTAEWQGAVDYLKGTLPKIWYFPNFLFELPEKFLLTQAAGSRPAEDMDKALFYRSTFERVLGELGTGANLDTHVVARLESADKTDERNLKALLLEMGRVITGTILDGWNRIFGSSPAGQEVDIDASTDAQGEPYLELRIKGQDGYYDLSERSLGFRWFFMFLLMTSYHGVRSKVGPRALFLLDEPASNLHSSAQAELLKSFESLSEDCHLVYTTHSHHMINVKWLDSAFVVKNEALGSLSFEDYVNTRIGARTSVTATRYRRFVSQHPGETSYFQPVLDLLEYKPSTLEPVPDVVLVEGKSDYFLLRYCTDVLGLHPALPLVPGGGAGKLDPLIRLHLGWGKSFVVLLDGDAEGLKQKARYEKEFGTLVAGRCHVLSDLIGDPSCCEGEDLLTPQDKDLLVQTVAGASTKATKKVVQRAVIEVFAGRQTVALEATTTARVSALLASLKKELDEQAV